MTIDAECPLCGNKGRVPEKFAGRQVKCPECCNVFIVSGSNGSAATEAGEKAKSATSGSAAGNQKLKTSGSAAGNQMIKTSGSVAGNQKLAKTGDTHHGTQKIVKPGGSNQGAAKVVKPSPTHQGTAKVVKPGGSNQGVAKGPGNPFSEIDRPEQAARKGQRKTDPDLEVSRPAGSRSNMISVVFSILLILGLAVGGTIAISQIAPDKDTTSPHAAYTYPTEPIATNPVTQPLPPTTAQVPTTKVTPPTKKEPPKDEWVDVSKRPVLFGDVALKVTEVKIDTVKGKDLENNDKVFQIKILLENRGDQRVDYRSWGTSEPVNDKMPPTMTDQYGKPYKRVTFPAGSQVDGQILAQSLKKGESVADLIFFQVPPDSSKYVQVELAAVNIGATGKLKLQIPNTMYSTGPLVKDPKKKGEPPNPGEENPAVTLLRKQLNASKTPKDVLTYLQALGGLGPLSVTAAADIAKHHSNGEVAVRATVAEVLGKLGPDVAKDAVPALKNLLKDKNAAIRGEAVRSLGKMGPAAKEALPMIIELIKDIDESVIEAVREAIKQISADANKE